MPVLPFGEWRPDLTDFQAETTRSIVNVAPRADGYGPLRKQQAYAGTLPAACRGCFLGVDNVGNPALFAGTLTRLYKMNNATLAWEDVSKGGVAYTALATQDNWTFVQYNNQVVACQRNVAPQVFTVAVSAAFADLAGSPPQAAYCTVVQTQLVLSGLPNQPHRVQWSAKDDITSWTLALNGADIQDFPDGGRVLGVAGGEFGVVFQDAAIRRMTFLPGSDLIFQFDRIAEGEGLRAPYSVISAGSRIFYLGTAGHMMIMGGAAPVNISKERWSRFFNLDWDSQQLYLTQGANEPNSSRVWFFYKSTGGQQNLFDKAILYDWVLERATYVTDISGEFAQMLSQPGITLDTLYTLGFNNIDTMTISLDDFTSSTGALLGIFDGSHKMGFLSGPTMQAILSTPEQAFEQRYFISQARPCTDDPQVYSTITHRSRIEDNPVTSTPSALNIKGFCPHRIDTRMARFTNVHNQGASWTFDTGTEPLLVNTAKL